MRGPLQQLLRPTPCMAISTTQVLPHADRKNFFDEPNFVCEARVIGRDACVAKEIRAFE